MRQRQRKARFPTYARILTGMALGVVVGALLGSRAAPLGELGKVLIQLIKALAAPLLFLAVVDAFLRTRIRMRSALLMLAIGVFNAVIALAIGLGVSNLLRPGDYIRLEKNAVTGVPATAPVHGLDFTQALTGLIPTSVVQPFVDNAILGVILLALLAGFALRKIKDSSSEELVIEPLVATLLKATQIALGWVIRFVPIAVFGVVAMMVGRFGFKPFQGLAVYVAAALGGLALQIGVVYQAWLILAGGFAGVKRFWLGARDAVVYAFGASSSLATLPVTLECLDEMQVTPQSSRLAACVGSNFNHDGIILYEAMAVLVVAQAHGIHLTLTQQAVAAAACLVAGVGIAGVPDAGLVSLALVIGTVGLPADLLPLLLTVDWLISRARAITNVLSDMVMAILLDRFSTSSRK